MSDEATPESSSVTVAGELPPTPTPTPPRGLEETEVRQLEARAQELTSQVTATPDRQVARGLGEIGSDAQRKAGHEIDLLKTKVGTLLRELDGPGARIPQGLLELRRTMDQINPHALSRQPQGFLSRLLGRTPAIGNVLADIATRYESVQTQIDTIVDTLRTGKDELLQDSLELERLYGQVRAAQLDVQKAAYLGEHIWRHLEAAVARESDPTERQRLETLLHRVAMRVQDLRTMEQVNEQFFVSIDLTISNNDHLSDAVSRTVTVTRSLLTVGLAIQSALASQKKILGAVQETQRYTSDMLAANAEAIRQQTAEIGDLYKNPVLALDKVKQAYDDLMGAMEQMEEIRQLGTEQARAGVAQLAEMSAALAPKAEALREARQFESEALPSGEAEERSGENDRSGPGSR